MFAIDLKDKLDFDELCKMTAEDRLKTRTDHAEKCQRPIIDKLSLKSSEYTINWLTNSLYVDDLTNDQIKLLKNDETIKSVSDVSNVITSRFY